jgi:predicted PurR-regulated permease PerM
MDGSPAQRAPERDVVRTVLVLAVLGALLAVSFLVLGPFLPAMVWAATIVVATWRPFLWIERRLWGRRKLAVLAMTILLLLVLLVPFTYAVALLVQHTHQITEWASSLRAESLQAPPDWVRGLPLAGEAIDEAWRREAQAGSIGERIAPYVRDLLTWFASKAGTLGGALVQFLLTVVVAAVLYAKGERAAEVARALARKLGGERGDGVLELAAQAVRGVALGVVVTAVIQSVLGGIGLWIAGVPFAPVLTAAMVLLALAQIGVWPVLGGAAVWLLASDQTGWGIAMFVWMVLVGALDNVMRPFLIRRGVKLSLLLIFAGVVGGLIAFGLIGIFLGPMVLGVTQALVAAWIAEPPAERAR